ncbi:hypothetical protein DYH09_04700 [bacterium CPR1]|nr:hypothetical protein [bacterium CPR1]
MRPRQRGYALALTLAMLSVLVLVIVGMARNGDASLNAARIQQRSDRALYAAESGVAAALVGLKKDAEFSGAKATLGPEKYAVTVYRPGSKVPNEASVPAGCVYILSTGTLGSTSRQVGVTVKLGPGSRPVTGAYYAHSLTLGGGSWTDSYDSTKGSYSSQKPGTRGDISTNSKDPGSIRLSGGSSVKGTISIGVGGVVGPGTPERSTKNTRNTVWKDAKTSSLDEEALSKKIELPAVTVPSLGPSQGDLKVNSKGASPAPGRYEDVSVSGGGTLTLGAGIYVVDSLKLTGGGKLSTSGAVRIYVRKKLDLSGGGVVNPSEKPANLVLMLAEGADAKITGGTMVVYGPGAEIKLSGSDLFGAIVGGKVSAAGGSRVHFDEALSTFSLDGAAGSSATRTILSWQRF